MERSKGENEDGKGTGGTAPLHKFLNPPLRSTYYIIKLTIHCCYTLCTQKFILFFVTIRSKITGLDIINFGTRYLQII